MSFLTRCLRPLHNVFDVGAGKPFVFSTTPSRCALANFFIFNVAGPSLAHPTWTNLLEICHFARWYTAYFSSSSRSRKNVLPLRKSEREKNPANALNASSWKRSENISSSIFRLYVSFFRKFFFWRRIRSANTYMGSSVHIFIKAISFVFNFSFGPFFRWCERAQRPM